MLHIVDIYLFTILLVSTKTIAGGHFVQIRRTLITSGLAVLYTLFVNAGLVNAFSYFTQKHYRLKTSWSACLHMNERGFLIQRSAVFHSTLSGVGMHKLDDDERIVWVIGHECFASKSCGNCQC